MKENKSIDYYRQMLHKDTIFLLVVAILFGILSLLLEGFGLFFKSILFICFYIILICNKKVNGTFIGGLGLVTGALMILTSIKDGSLFGGTYLLLGIIYIIHSIIYLVKLKNETLILQQQTKNKSKIIYLNLGLVILSIISFFVGIIFFGKSIEILFVIITFLSLLFVFCSSVFLIIKKHKGLLLYIIFVISMFGGVVSVIMLIPRISSMIDYIKYNNSDKSKIDILVKLEDSLSFDVSDLSEEGFLIQPLNEKSSYVLIDKKHYEDSILVWNKKGYRTKESVYNKKELEGYNCDGYTELKIDYDSYEQCLVNNEIYCERYLERYSVNSYISCNGKYTYKTKGFDENKFQESKSDDYYKMYNMKKLEHFFKEDVISFSEKNLLPQPSSNTSLIIKKNDYELLESNNLGIQSRFKEDELEGITCDGYVELSLDDDSKVAGKSYIKCLGEYNYVTEGFDENKLS